MRPRFLLFALALLPGLAAAQKPDLGVTNRAPNAAPVPAIPPHQPTTGAPALVQDDPAPFGGASLNAGPNNSTPFSGMPVATIPWNRATPQDTGGSAGGANSIVPNVSR
jgi:hypothetical protein